MPTPALNLTQDARASAWRAVVDVLQVDDDLRGLVNVWRLPDDPEYDDEPPNEVVTVKVVPQYGPLVPIALAGWGKRLWEGTVELGFEIHTPGMPGDNYSNLWGVIEIAANGGNRMPAERVKLVADYAAAGLFDIDAITPAVTVLDNGVAVGSMTLVVQVER